MAFQLQTIEIMKKEYTQLTHLDETLKKYTRLNRFNMLED